MLWLKELLTTRPPQTEYLVHPFLRPATKLMIVGPAKSHKSFMLHTLLYALATGTPVWGNPHFWVRQPVPGLLFSQELTQSVLQERWGQHVFGERLSPEVLKQRWETSGGARIQLLRDNLAFAWKGDYSLDDRETAKRHNLWAQIELFRAQRGFYPIWIAFDPISKFHHKEENKQEQVMEVIQVLDEIQARTAAALILVHHEGVPTHEKLELRHGLARVRGSSQWHADVDAGITVLRDRKRREHGLTFDLRHAEDEPPIVVKHNPQTLLFDFVRTSDPPSLDDEEAST